MTTRFLGMTSFCATLGAFASLGCGAHTLDVGSNDGGGPGSSSSSGGSISYSGGCTAASCANSTAQCSGIGSSAGTATPENLKCVPDPNAGQGSDPAGSCILSFVCSVPSTDTAADGGACPPWTTPGTATSCSGGVCSAGSTVGSPGQASGFVSLELDPSADGTAASTTLSAYFTESGASTSAQTLGACIYDPEGANRPTGGLFPGSPSPDPGPITATGPTLSLAASPACDGTYAPVTTPKTFAGGDLLSFAWQPPPAPPEDMGGSAPFPTTALPQVPAPHLVALGAGQVLAAAAPTIPRASDAAVSWTVTGTPMSLEQVIVVFTQGTASVTCSFTASAGSGVVPADALLKLDAAQASYAVFSQHAAALGPASEWDVSFFANAIAATPAGLAKGTATLQ